MDQTLVLNASYEPLRVVPWQKAITLLFQGKVEVIAVYDREIRGVTVRVRLPSVLRLLRHVRMKRSFAEVPFSRQQRLRSRRASLSVLRRAVPSVPADLRPRDPRCPGWAQGMGQHRHLLHPLQQEERGPAPGARRVAPREAAATPAGPASPDADPRNPPDARQLARLPVLGRVLGRTLIRRLTG